MLQDVNLVWELGPGLRHSHVHPGMQMMLRRMLHDYTANMRGSRDLLFPLFVGKSLCAFSRNRRAFSVSWFDNAAVAISMQRSASSLFTSISITGPEVNKDAGWWRHRPCMQCTTDMLSILHVNVPVSSWLKNSCFMKICHARASPQ